MINSLTVRNFRCFEHLSVERCKRVNVIVGDNGSGKTALLEAIFLALGVTTDVPLRYRQQRGQEGLFSGSAHAIEEAIYGSFSSIRTGAESFLLNWTGVMTTIEA